jgi:hypothetical protein
MVSVPHWTVCFFSPTPHTFSLFCSWKHTHPNPEGLGPVALKSSTQKQQKRQLQRHLPKMFSTPEKYLLHILAVVGLPSLIPLSEVAHVSLSRTSFLQGDSVPWNRIVTLQSSHYFSLRARQQLRHMKIPSTHPCPDLLWKMLNSFLSISTETDVTLSMSLTELLLLLCLKTEVSVQVLSLS